MSRFGLETGIDFDHNGLKSGMVFNGTTYGSVVWGTGRQTPTENTEEYPCPGFIVHKGLSCFKREGWYFQKRKGNLSTKGFVQPPYALVRV